MIIKFDNKYDKRYLIALHEKIKINEKMTIRKEFWVVKSKMNKLKKFNAKKRGSSGWYVLRENSRIKPIVIGLIQI